MRKKTKLDVLKIIGQFRQVLEKKPATQKMFEEVRMMKFRVHPVMGDISAIDLQNKELIATLWSLGKLDEFFQKQYQKLTSREKNIFLRFVDNLQQKLQEELNRINLKRDKEIIVPTSLEFEIFKDQPTKKLN